MAINFSVSKEDLLRSKAGKPGWYVCLVKSVEVKPGVNNPQANVVHVSMVIDSGPDPAVIGAPVKHYLPETAPGLAVPFIEAVTGKGIPESGANLDLSIATGRKVRADLVFDTEFKSWKCKDFAPVSGKVER